MRQVTSMRSAILIAVTGLSLLILLTVTPAPGAQQLAVVIPPWKRLDETMNTLMNLDVRLVRHGMSDRIVIVDTAQDPNSREELGNLGVVLMDPRVIGACAALLETRQALPFRQ